ncbi:MAG TPA: MFS transporter [Candidatus Polarisedimenticolia bacterium]|nr:MFS transporter [Candidatus Polarisedimenticolia bacterium]
MTPVQRGTLAAAILGSSIVFLDGTIVNIALPQIGRELPATLVGTLEGQTYVTSGYLATLAALLILAGALGDFYGRRRMFLIGLAGFGATSVLCGLSPTLEILALARVLQGAAGALLVPGSLSIITALFEGPERGRAFGIWAAATSATTTLGPPIGGILVEALSWRSAFLVNVPLVAVAIWLAIRYMPETRDDEAKGGFDWLGSLVAAVAIGGLAFGLVRGQEKRWADQAAWIAIALGVVATVAFPILMARRPNPLVPLALFKNRNFAVVNLSTLLIYGALYANFGFQGLFLQGILGYSPLAAAVTGLPVGIILTLFSARAGALAGRMGARRFLAIGPLIMAAGMLWWARIPADSTPWTAGVGAGLTVPPASVFIDVLPAVLLFAVGISLVVAPLTTTLMSSVPVRNAGLGSAINNAISRVGQPLLSAIVFIVVSGSFYVTLASLVPGLDPNSESLRATVQPLNPPTDGTSSDIAAAARIASTDAYHLAALVGAALLAAGGAVNWFGLHGNGPAGGTTQDG